MKRNKLSKLKNLFAGLVLSSSLSACSSYNLDEFPSEVQVQVNKSNAQTLDSYFTSKAALALEKIPISLGETIGSNNYAAGRNLLVKLVEYLFLGLGFERKTVVTRFHNLNREIFDEDIEDFKDSELKSTSALYHLWELSKYNPDFLSFSSPDDVKIGKDAYSFWLGAKIQKGRFDEVMLHENVHHASAIGLINDSEFSSAWEIMAQDPRYEPLCFQIDAGIDARSYSFWIDALLIWRDLEREAELAGEIILNNREAPIYMRRVYRKTFRKFEHLE